MVAFSTVIGSLRAAAASALSSFKTFFRILFAEMTAQSCTRGSLAKQRRNSRGRSLRIALTAARRNSSTEPSTSEPSWCSRIAAERYNSRASAILNLRCLTVLLQTIPEELASFFLGPTLGT